MKLWRMIKFWLYIVAGILVLIFNKFCLENAQYVVGGVMIAYAIEDLIVWGVVKGVVAEKTKFFEAIILLVLAFILIFLVNDEYNKCLIIWGVWSIIREGNEITECMIRLSKKRPALLNLAESIIVIVLSVTMIMEPGEHHAHVHIYLLGIELILEVIFPFANMYIDRYLAVRHAKKHNLPIPHGPLTLEEEEENIEELVEELQELKKELNEANLKLKEYESKQEAQ